MVQGWTCDPIITIRTKWEFCWVARKRVNRRLELLQPSCHPEANAAREWSQHQTRVWRSNPGDTFWATDQPLLRARNYLFSVLSANKSHDCLSSKFKMAFLSNKRLDQARGLRSTFQISACILCLILIEKVQFSLSPVEGCLRAALMPARKDHPDLNSQTGGSPVGSSSKCPN